MTWYQLLTLGAVGVATACIVTLPEWAERQGYADNERCRNRAVAWVGKHVPEETIRAEAPDLQLWAERAYYVACVESLEETR